MAWKSVLSLSVSSHRSSSSDICKNSYFSSQLIWKGVILAVLLVVTSHNCSGQQFQSQQQQQQQQQQQRDRRPPQSYNDPFSLNNNQNNNQFPTGSGGGGGGRVFNNVNSIDNNNNNSEGPFIGPLDRDRNRASSPNFGGGSSDRFPTFRNSFGQPVDEQGRVINNNNRQDGNVNFPSFGPTTNRNDFTPFGGGGSRRDNFPGSDSGGGRTSPNLPPISFNNNQDPSSGKDLVIREPRYFIVASRIVRPGQVYRVAVTIFQSQSQSSEIEVRASLLKNGVDIGSDTKICLPNNLETLMIKVPRTSVGGNYRLRVEGNDNGLVGGTAFVNETDLNFSQRSMTIFIQTDKPAYMQGQTVRFRAIPINTAMRAFDDAVDVFMLDPRGNVVRRWLSRQSNFGAVSLNYTLSDQPVYGNWTIRVQALQQVEEKQFKVEEYYQPRFEVNVTTPAFYFNTDEHIEGLVTANYTSGGPVYGNLTLRLSMRPIGWRYPPNYEPSSQEALVEDFVERFEGYYAFRFSMYELRQRFSQLENMEATITAKVGEPYWNEILDGYSRARIYNSSLRLQFLGGSPQVFKPAMPFTAYLTISYHDGSPLAPFRLTSSKLEIQAEVISGSGRRSLSSRNVRQLPGSPGIWKVTFDLKQELSVGPGLDRPRQMNQIVNDVQSLRLQAVFSNPYRESASAELLAVAHYSPKNRHIRVQSSTSNPKVGEYIVFHVRGNFMMDRFSYVIMAKGVILLSGTETMDATIRTFAISVSPEMAPAATIVVYHVSKYMDVVADSLTFPVNGISRNNFTVAINNKKEKTNNVVEVIIRGQPGAYVGLSGLDAAFYTMQAGNDISYADVLKKMINFDEDSNGTLIHKWTSRDGLPDQVVYFPSHSYGIDANRTFDFTGLVVFTDIPLPRKQDFCNQTAGQYSCLTMNQCYYSFQRCDGLRQCNDGTDESNCPYFNETELIQFKLERFNRMYRLYENVWLWKDINIGPQGYFIFSLPVPSRPVLWMVSAIGVSPKAGFGLLRSPIIYSGVRPLFMNVEMPERCRQGEQVGIRVTVFNYMLKPVEVMVILANSPHYKFVHVEQYGYVESYSPRTSQGEHQHLIWIKPQDAVQVHFPIVPTKLGEVKVSVKVISQIALDEVTNTLTVDPDGVPQYRHTSVLLDLSNRAFVLQYLHVNVTESPIIPYEYIRYYVYSSNLADISVVGDIVGPAFPTMPVNATSLLSKPMDSAEQSMFSFAANFYTLWYLRLTNQKDRHTYRQAFHHLNVALQRQLSFQNDDGSFSYFRSDWGHSQPSVWVTAYCARVFNEAIFNEWENFLYIDSNIIARAVSWVLQFQTSEGSFYEVSPYSDRKLNDTLFSNGYIQQPNITLTAHVLIALQSVKDLPGELGPRLNYARQRARYYLETKVDHMRSSNSGPYEIAIVAYALMFTQSSKADQAFILLSEKKKFEGGLAYWGRVRVPVPDFKLENNKPFLLPRLPHMYDSENIEATAYALMVYTNRQELQTDAIVKWLNTQRLHEGGWASTQDTVVAMRALIEYTIKSRIRDVTNLTVNIEAVALADKITPIHVHTDNLAKPQRVHIPNAYGTVKVEAKGAGYAILQLRVQYGVDIDRFITEPPVRAFSLRTQAFFYGRNASMIEYRSCSSWTYLEESDQSGMAVLEVKIPTGYYIYQPKLNKYVQSKEVPNLKYARYAGDKVFLYFDYLDRYETCVNFTVERWFPVANMTRYLPIRVYDYYAPERFNETIFDAYTTYRLDICQVCGSYQCPYCPIFAAGPKTAGASSLIIICSSFVSLTFFYYSTVISHSGWNILW